MDYNESILEKVVWYYYFEDMTQQEISSTLNISRMRVVKLLELARQSGVIQFRIKKDSESRMSTEKEIMKKYGLKDILVVPSVNNATQEQTNESIAKACAMYLNDRLTENRFINIGYGDTSNRTLNHLATIADPSISCIALTGGVSYYLPNAKSSVFNATLNLIPTPLLMSSEDMVESIKQEDSVKDILRMVSLAAFSVVGIGSLDQSATIFGSGIISQNDLIYLKAQGAVGDILSHFINKKGEIIPSSLESRLISTSLEQLRTLNNVIGVAAGKGKASAIKAVLRAGYLDILITDEHTANELLN